MSPIRKKWSSKTGTRKADSKPSANTRWTYRFLRHGKAAESHHDSRELALERAIWDVHNYYAVPVHIRQEHHIYLDEDDILDAWEEKYLKPAT